jgi:hypothetical protein
MVTMNTEPILDLSNETYLWCYNCKLHIAKSRVPLINKCRKCPECNKYQTLRQIIPLKPKRVTVKEAAIQREHTRIRKGLLND